MSRPLLTPHPVAGTINDGDVITMDGSPYTLTAQVLKPLPWSNRAMRRKRTAQSRHP